MEKTNVMRVLDSRKIAYTPHFYEADPSRTGAQIAALLGEDPAHVFKTLVTAGRPGKYYVFVIPVEEELNLKKAAAAVGEKSVGMLPQKELLPLTGYVHGGCSPIGMKKTFPTFIHSSAESFDYICVSAGRVGAQIEINPHDLSKLMPCVFSEII
jgi:Cys-tRNA(Pro)/Cys-tRNA(Cys) deacylase